jgi:EpsI family protein
MMRWRSFSFAALLLILTLILVFRVNARGAPVVLSTNLENLPMQIAAYQGQEDFFSQAVYEELQADLHVYRHYQSAVESIGLYIGYYGTAKGGRSSHNPYACLPGAGWGIVDKAKIFLRPSYREQGVQINYVVARMGESYNVVLHWYHSAGTKVLATGLQQNLQRFQGKVLYNRNDGAYVQISSVTGKDAIPAVKERLTAFASEVLELLPNYWPEEGLRGN